jgi:hypothetical protein
MKRALLGLALVLVVSACQPVDHSVFDTIEPVEGPATLLGLSRNGTFAVVSSTGPSETVPGAGTFVVDRRDGSVVQLPTVAYFRAISDDGQRVHYDAATGEQQIWDDGTVKTPPFGAVMSQDLRYGIFMNVLALDARRWDVATNARIALETGFPRPAGLTLRNTNGMGISPDGNAAWFQLASATACTTRFVWRTQAIVRDLGRCGDMTVSANGSFTALHQDAYEVSNPFTGTLKFVGSIDVVNNLTGKVVSSVAPATNGTTFDTIVLSDTGWTLWAVAISAEGTFPPDCGGMSNPICTGGFTAHEVVAATPERVRRFPADPDLVLSASTGPSHASTSADGRFFASAPRRDGADVQVIDRLHGTVEILPSSVPGRPSTPWLSADGQLVAYAAAPPQSSPGAPTGWFEHRAAS